MDGIVDEAVVVNVVVIEAVVVVIGFVDDIVVVGVVEVTVLDVDVNVGVVNCDDIVDDLAVVVGGDDEEVELVGVVVAPGVVEGPHIWQYLEQYCLARLASEHSFQNLSIIRQSMPCLSLHVCTVVPVIIFIIISIMSLPFMTLLKYPYSFKGKIYIILTDSEDTEWSVWLHRLVWILPSTYVQKDVCVFFK